MAESEVPLTGGDVTEGVVRIGDTVRRPRGPHTPTVHRVLRHLEVTSFDGAPRVLGVAEQGREILTFVPGEVAARPWPEWVADERRGLSVARLARRLDDAMMPLGLPDGAPEEMPAMAEALRRPGPSPTFLGHRDLTPENTVFHDELAVAFIDFDLVRPSSRVDEAGGPGCGRAGWGTVSDVAPSGCESSARSSMRRSPAAEPRSARRTRERAHHQRARRAGRPMSWNHDGHSKPYREDTVPSTLIEVRRSYTRDQQLALIDAVHAALVAGFRIPEDDRYIRLTEFEPHAMVNGLQNGVADTYTRVTIDCFSGRSIEAKRALYRQIVERLGEHGIPPEHVSILLRESPPENWGSGGIPASDYDLGFDINV